MGSDSSRARHNKSMPLSASIGDRMAFSTEATLDDFRFASYERARE
jgi:hypothetical protein